MFINVTDCDNDELIINTEKVVYIQLNKKTKGSEIIFTNGTLIKLDYINTERLKSKTNYK